MQKVVTGNIKGEYAFCCKASQYQPVPTAIKNHKAFTFCWDEPNYIKLKLPAVFRKDGLSHWLELRHLSWTGNTSRLNFKIR